MIRKVTGRMNNCIVLGSALLAVAIATVGMTKATTPAAAQSHRENVPEHFKSGGERSLAILHEISNTLKQIDMRLQRIEQASTTTKQMDARLQRIEQVIVRAADRTRRVSPSSMDSGR